jgi:hypothetical protein
VEDESEHHGLLELFLGRSLLPSYDGNRLRIQPRAFLRLQTDKVALLLAPLDVRLGTAGRSEAQDPMNCGLRQGLAGQQVIDI